MSKLPTTITLATQFGFAVLLVALCPIILWAVNATAPNRFVPKSETSNPSALTSISSVSKTNPDAIGKNEKFVSSFVANMIERGHLSNRAIDDNVSSQALTRYIEMLDPSMAYFLQADVEEFSKWKNRLDDQMKSGDYTAAFEIFQRFLQRVDERTQDAIALVDSSHDFSIDEELIIADDQLDYAADENEAREMWRKRTKYALIVLRNSQNDTSVGVAKSPKEILRNRYLSFANRMNQLDNESVIERYITAITTSLDPHTTYLSKGSLDNFMIQMSLELEGIGATLQSNEEGYTVIQSIVEGGAAANQGDLKVKDRIVAVAQGKPNGSSVDPNLVEKYGTDFVDAVGLNSDDVVGMIRGEVGTTVRLSVLRDGEAPVQTIQIVRQKIKLEDQAARGNIFEEGLRADDSPQKIGVIKLPMFYTDMTGPNGSGRSTTSDVREILEDFNAEDVDALVLDLRFNGGGSLQEAVNCTGLFIDWGPVVQVKNAYGRIQVLNDSSRALAWSRPMIVLTNKFSASASEILAGAIQDYQRGLVVGDTTTHGKGTVQHLMNISQMVRNTTDVSNEFGALKLTVQQFYRPNGDSTQLRGVRSDITLPSVTEEMGIGESELDCPVDFDRIRRARFEPYGMTNPDSTELLRSNSKSRCSESAKFHELDKKIARFVERKNRNKVSLNEQEFLANRRATNSDSNDEATMVEMAMPSSKIGRDFYLDEVLKITSDYLTTFSKS